MQRAGRLLWWSAGLLALCLAGCFGNSPPEPLPVGHVVPLSGPAAFGGERARHGVQLALEDLNKEDKRGTGRPILVQHADARHAAGTATRLIKIDRVMALLDSTDPGQLLGLAAAATAGETPLLTTSPLSRLPQNEYVFSLVASPAYQGQVLARFAREDLKLESIVALSDSRIPACSVLVDAFAGEFTKAGGRIGPGAGAFDSDATLAERVAQVGKAGPAAVLFAGTGRHLAQVAAQMHQASPTAPILFGGDEAALLDLASTTAAGKVYLGTAFATEGLSEAGQEAARAYKERFGQDLDVHAVLAIDGIRLLTEALRKARSPGQGVRKEIASVEEFASLTGPLSFTAEGCARRPVFVVAVEGGKVRLARSFPAEAKR